MWILCKPCSRFLGNASINYDSSRPDKNKACIKSRAAFHQCNWNNHVKNSALHQKAIAKCEELANQSSGHSIKQSTISSMFPMIKQLAPAVEAMDSGSKNCSAIASEMLQSSIDIQHKYKIACKNKSCNGVLVPMTFT